MTNEWLNEIVKKEKGREYDVAVMYSGGKDSSYLLYLLKEVYKLRVVAVYIDNGFENRNQIDIIRKFPDQMGVEFIAIHPPRDLFVKLYHTLITESDLFRREKTNHVCFICNNVLWCKVTQYAALNNIPYVASGLSLTQLSSGRPYSLVNNKLANSIAERSTKQVLKNALQNFVKTEIYSLDNDFKEFIDGLNNSISMITTIYPYIYHQISVEELKSKIMEMGWLPPNGRSIGEYISSGCQIMSYVIKELEKIGIVTLNEREQARVMVDSGLLDERSMEFARYDASKDDVILSNAIMDEIDVKDYLINKCEEFEKNILYEK